MCLYVLRFRGGGHFFWKVRTFWPDLSLGRAFQRLFEGPDLVLTVGFGFELKLGIFAVQVKS